MEYFDTNKLNNISCCFLGGEITGLLGLTSSGKDMFVRLISGEFESVNLMDKVRIAGRPVSRSLRLADQVYCMRERNYIISDWTGEEYIALVGRGTLSGKRKTGLLVEEARSLLKACDRNISLNTKLRNMPEFDKRVLDMVKARVLQKKVLIIEEEFSLLSGMEIVRLGRLLKELLSEDMTAIVNSHSDFVSSALGEKFILFYRGQIIKKFRKTSSWNIREWKRYVAEEGEGEDSAFRHEGKAIIREETRIENIHPIPGKVISVITIDNRKKEAVYSHMQGLAYKKRACIHHLGSRKEIFLNMSVEDNLILPSLYKLFGYEYIFHAREMEGVFSEELASLKGVPCSVLETNDIIRITLERWYIYNPEWILIMDPFIECDMEGVDIVQSYIRKYCDKGIGVVIVNARKEYVAGISDFILRI